VKSANALIGFAKHAVNQTQMTVTVFVAVANAKSSKVPKDWGLVNK